MLWNAAKKQAEEIRYVINDVGVGDGLSFCKWTSKPNTIDCVSLVMSCHLMTVCAEANQRSSNK